VNQLGEGHNDSVEKVTSPCRFRDTTRMTISGPSAVPREDQMLTLIWNICPYAVVYVPGNDCRAAFRHGTRPSQS